MRLRGVLAIVMILTGAVVTTPVRAVTFDLGYTAAFPNNACFTSAGGGFFSAPDKPSIGLQDLTAFFFTWSNFGFGGAPPSPFAAGLPDLLSFSATVSGTTVTSLALSTRLVTNPDPKLGPGILQRHQPGARWRRERTEWDTPGTAALSASWPSPSE